MSAVTDAVILDRLWVYKNYRNQFFQHYKTKNTYVVDAVSLLEEDMTTVMITYHPANKAQMSFTRTAANFFEKVTGDDGVKVSRFTRIVPLAG